MSSQSNPLNEKVARTVLRETLGVRKGDNVTIESWSEALPWAVPFVNEARRIGARPMMLYEDEAAFWEALEDGEAQATGRVGDHEWSALAKTDAYVFFFGPSQWTRLDDLPARKTVGVAAYNLDWYQRAGKARVRGARMYLGRTSESAAARFGIDLGGWRDALQKASLASPKKMHALADRVAARLRRGKRVRVTHENGTDLTFDLGRFPVQIDDGLVDQADLKSKNNMATVPGGVIGVAVDDTSAEGTALGNHIIYPATGPAEGPHWTFHDGRLVEYSYDKGGSEFAAAYSKAPKNGKDRLSYVSVGLNPAIEGCPQMEDQELGAILLRIGGNRFVGGKNKSTFGSWMTLSGADLTVDGRPVVRGGSIV